MSPIAIIFFVLTTSISLFIIYLFYILGRNKYLVFSSVGDKNNVDSWLSDPTKKKFDFIAFYYGDKSNPPLGADKVIKRKGLKFDNFLHYLQRNNIKRYKAVWVVDDDIIIDTQSISTMFDIFSKHDLWLAQPSFDRESLAPHIVTINKPGCLLHYTNFIENGVALFSTETASRLKDTFRDAGTGYGVDFIWIDHLRYPVDKIAVIDAVTCNHPKSDYSALDLVVPRHLHESQGIELLIKYKLLPENWKPTEAKPWPIPYELQEFKTIANNPKET